MISRYDPGMVDGFAVECILNGVRMNTHYLNADTKIAAVIALAGTCIWEDIEYRVGVTEQEITRILKTHKRNACPTSKGHE